MPERVKAFVVPPGGGRPVQGPAGGPATIKAGTHETAGSLAFVENVIPPKQGPPLHIHAREDEMRLVLQGDLRFRPMTRSSTLQPGRSSSSRGEPRTASRTSATRPHGSQ